MQKILLDARAMAHPEPLQQAIAHLQTLSDDSYLYMLNRKKPVPLLAMVAEKHYAHLAQQAADETWHILICKNPDADLVRCLDV